MATGKAYALKYITLNEKIMRSIRNPIKLRVLETKYSESNDFKFQLYLSDEKYAAWATVSNHCLEQLQQQHQLEMHTLLNDIILSLEGSYIELQDYSLIPFLPPQKERCAFLICIQQFAAVGGPSNPHVNKNYLYLPHEEDVRERLLFLWNWNQPVKQSVGIQKEAVSEGGLGSSSVGNEASKGDSNNIADIEEPRNADASWDANMDSFEFSDPVDIYDGKHPPLVTSPSSAAEERTIEKDAEHQNSSLRICFNSDQESLTKDSSSIVKNFPHGKISHDQDTEHSSLTESLHRKEKATRKRTLRSSRGTPFGTPNERNCSDMRPKPIAQPRDLDPPSGVGPSSESCTGDRQRIEFYKKWPSDKIQQSVLHFWKENRKLKKDDINERLAFIRTLYPKNKLNNFAVSFP